MCVHCMMHGHMDEYMWYFLTLCLLTRVCHSMLCAYVFEQLLYLLNDTGICDRSIIVLYIDTQSNIHWLSQ